MCGLRALERIGDSDRLKPCVGAVTGCTGIDEDRLHDDTKDMRNVNPEVNRNAVD